jgi:hypothetical protein
MQLGYIEQRQKNIHKNIWASVDSNVGGEMHVIIVQACKREIISAPQGFKKGSSQQNDGDMGAALPGGFSHWSDLVICLHN